ncbi:MAG: hypothetical protein H6744_09330 [Deltaproteobacteria bacterium]|nr:hypothetical protein [Deltaproteobacteria bacterium]
MGLPAPGSALRLGLALCSALAGCADAPGAAHDEGLADLTTPSDAADADAVAELPRAPAGQCDPCTGVLDCPTGWSCTPLVTGKACLAPCGSDGECAAGWACQGGVCSPAGYRCDGCATAGCDAGQACDLLSGACVAARAPCEACTEAWECGPEAACLAHSDGLRRCKRRCTTAADCPQGGTCAVDDESGVRYCSSGPAACPGEGLVCAAPTPYVWQAECVQCRVDADCESGSCASATHRCVHDGDACASCGGAYPACVEIDDASYCVPCADDSYCGSGCHCDTTSYTCVGSCETNPPHEPEPCDDGTVCDPGITGFDLSCEASSQRCVDASGGCDDITAFCRGGAPCWSNMLALSGAGGIPGIPDPGDKGATLKGACACDPLVELLARPDEKVCGAGHCVAVPGASEPPGICYPP